jgi:23S rRNA (adenine2503-C2)-methyltransferase
VTTTTAAPRVALLGLPRERLEELVAPHLDRPFRGEQLWRALYEQGVEDLAAVTTLGRELRERLAERFEVGRPQLADAHRSADGTTKLLLRLADGATVETVDIPDARRRTLCLSSQAGCALGCRFCVTGFWGAGRDLTAGEIVGQVLAATGRLQASDSLNLVYMGMGEPLLNLDAVRDSLEVLTQWISWRRVTVSTVGVLPALAELASWPRRPNLAISLHAPDDERRSAIMPVNRSWPLADLLSALRRFPLEPGRRLTFEYILIRDFNDREEDARALARRLVGLRAKVNLIPLNADPVLGPEMRAPDPGVVDRFRRDLVACGVTATVRRRRGDDVSAACGQLRALHREPRGFRRSNLSL